MENKGIPVTTGLDTARANEYFEQFVNATSLKNILGYYRGLVDSLNLKANYFALFYPKLKANLTSWRAKALLKKFDSRAAHKCYQKGKLASNTRVLVIGGGPCGMRTAIEAQLLGAKVVVIEKRDRFSRNNVLHLWPFVIEDLRMLGAKKFFGKFCAGAIDHISIRQLQCILLKVALLLGVEVHTEVSFETLIEPNAAEKIGWRAQFKPANHPVSHYEFDVVIGADGKRNTLQGFTRKEFRGKLAIAITANFINKRTEAEARVEEISGVAFIFNQKFFKDLQEATRIDLENIVYYKDDTHYFVMTAKKHSLIEKGVIKQDFADTEKLLAPENVDKEALQQYAIEAASFSTNYQMHNLEFAVNHYGQPDIAMFDFTSMYAAENASKVVERNGYRLLKILVGDSLLEPFWPTGSGCARGFLSALDAAWAIRSWALGTASPLDVMAERESIYRLLAQTTPDNLNKDWKSYTLDPSTRYPNLNKAVVMPNQVVCLFDTDNPASIERMKRISNERPNEVPKKRRRGNVDDGVLINWLNEQLKDVEDVSITDVGSIFKNGKVLCAIIHHYRPDLLEYSAIINNDAEKNNQIAIEILEKDLGVPPVMTGSEITATEDFLAVTSYLTEIYDCFRGEIPHVKQPKLISNLKVTNSVPLTVSKCCYIPLNNESNSANRRKPCKKCFEAYHSDLKYFSCENIPVSLTQSVINLLKYKKKGCRGGTDIADKSRKVIFKNSSVQKIRRKTVKMIKNDLLNESSNIEADSKTKQQHVSSIPLKYVEKLYHKKEKLKKILLQLMKKKSLNCTKSTLSIIPEANACNIKQETNIHDENIEKTNTLAETCEVKSNSKRKDPAKVAEQNKNNLKEKEANMSKRKNESDEVKSPSSLKAYYIRRKEANVSNNPDDKVKSQSRYNKNNLNKRKAKIPEENEADDVGPTANKVSYIDRKELNVANKTAQSRYKKYLNEKETKISKENNTENETDKVGPTLKHKVSHIDRKEANVANKTADKVTSHSRYKIYVNERGTNISRENIAGNETDDVGPTVKHKVSHIQRKETNFPNKTPDKVTFYSRYKICVNERGANISRENNAETETDDVGPTVRHKVSHMDRKEANVANKTADKVITHSRYKKYVNERGANISRENNSGNETDDVGPTVKHKVSHIQRKETNFPNKTPDKVVTSQSRYKKYLNEKEKNIFKENSTGNETGEVRPTTKHKISHIHSKEANVPNKTADKGKSQSKNKTGNETDEVRGTAKYKIPNIDRNQNVSNKNTNEFNMNKFDGTNEREADIFNKKNEHADKKDNSDEFKTIYRRTICDTSENYYDINQEKRISDKLSIIGISTPKIHYNIENICENRQRNYENNKQDEIEDKVQSTPKTDNILRSTIVPRTFANKGTKTDTEIHFPSRHDYNEVCDPRDKIGLFVNNLYRRKMAKKKSPVYLPCNERSVKIHVIEKRSESRYSLQTIKYMSSINHVTISSRVNDIPLQKITSLKKYSRKRTCGRSASVIFPIAENSNSSKKIDTRDIGKRLSKRQCQLKLENRKKFLSKIMVDRDGIPSQIYNRVSHWMSTNDFNTNIDNDSMISNSKITDITSVSKMDTYDDVIVEERTQVLNFNTPNRLTSPEEELVRKLRNIKKTVRPLSKFSQYSPFQQHSVVARSAPAPSRIVTVVERKPVVKELPLVNKKVSELSFKSLRPTIPATATQTARPSSRHRHKHNEVSFAQKVASTDRKPRKKRTLERVASNTGDRNKMLEELAVNRAERQNKRRYQRKLQTEQFLKSMQMLQANDKPDSQPFEDYSIFLYRQTAPKFEDRVKDLERQFTYVPDHETKPSHLYRAGGKDEDIAAKIKNLESKWSQPQTVDKKPKDLLRAIGKIETSDWNIKEIEKKIMENKLGKPSRAIDKEKVPKWSKEQFLARQTKMEKQHLDRQNSAEAKFVEFDRSIKHLDQKIKEGSVRELGQNKVASITEKLVSKIPTEPKPPERSTNRQVPLLPSQNASEFCHFCKKRVYLMERLSAEGRFFHHGCFKCQYCQVQLRLGSYLFDRDGLYGYRFFCLQHFGMLGEAPSVKVTRKSSVKRADRTSPEKKPLPGIAGVDLLDKVQTPERIEFSNLSSGHISSDQEDSLNQIDEDEWTDKNFGASCAELDDTDDESSSISDSDSDDEDAFDDALEEPATKEGTLKWAERWKNSYSRRKRNSDSNEYSSTDQSSYYDSSDGEESETATEGEEEIRARELRKKEVCVEPPIVHTDTGTDTEIVSDETSSKSSSEIQNSATEISTDSEFAQDDPTPTREIPAIILNDFNVNKTRGGGGGHLPKKIQVTSRYLQRPSDGKTKKPNIELKLSPLVVPSAPPVKKPAPLTLTRPEGYSLNRTQSTGGIAAKVSLELKKKYLLGETNLGNIQKSGSASTLDTKFKSFHTNISDCQKLLKPSPEISAGMQTFCKKLNELKSPALSPQPSFIFTKEIEPVESENNRDVAVKTNEETAAVFENESEGRPRSPLHETSIIVPQIDWSKQNDSLTSDSLASSDSDSKNPKSMTFENIPRVEVHRARDDEERVEEFVPDSLITEKTTGCENPSIEPPKSITSEKKTLNQPKTLPNLENLLPEIHNSLHIKYKKDILRETPEKVVVSSGRSSPESAADQITTALTETELSDWARDEVVSDDFEDGEFEIHIKYPDKSDPKKTMKMADLLEFEDSVSLQKGKSEGLKDARILTEAMNNVLSVNLDNIEFMDTGTETSSDDGIANSQNGYVLFKNEDDFAEDSLNPNINDIVEAINVNILADEKSDTPELKHSEISKHTDQEDENSTQVVESGTTTEENTVTDSTVKNVTDIHEDKLLTNNNVDVLEKIDVKDAIDDTVVKQNIDNIEFEEHCQRLQSKIEFSNVKDSIDVRKSRRKSKTDLLQKPDLITEESAAVTPSKNVSLTLTTIPHTPDILYNKDVIKKERDTNQKLIQEMVMNKMKAENKSLERRKRNKSTASPKSPFDITKSATVIDVSQINSSKMDKSVKSLRPNTSSANTTPDVLLSINYPLQSSKTTNSDFIISERTFSTPKSQYSDQFLLNTDAKMSNKSIFDYSGDNVTPKAPPRYHKSAEEMNRKLEKLKQTVRLRNKEKEQSQQNKENSNLNIGTREEERSFSRRCVSGNYETSRPSFSILDQKSLSSRAKSIPHLQMNAIQTISSDPDRIKVYKSDPNILEANAGKNKKKCKDRERRKSITKLITDFFTKKSPTSNGTKGLFSKLSPKSKSCTNLDFKKDVVIREAPQRKCLSESFIDRNTTPPPVPPLPSNYVRKTDESSDGEEEHKPNHSSCDTLDFTGMSTGSMAGRRSIKSRRVSRQAQLKRHRMAQEIQRKLEETEVKMKELEDRGVTVEKALRGEGCSDVVKDEADLLQEWFDLMRDRTELRRYERELTVRAQELELEDRHARLQYELRERIEDEKTKTKEDIDVEESIINEMIQIVEKRDSLIAEIEEDRLRYSNEDKDLEEQMLAKGLRLTPIKGPPEH